MLAHAILAAIATREHAHRPQGIQH